MSKEGYRTATIQHSVRTLRAVARKCNLLIPETVKDYLAKPTVSETRKVKICEDLDRFYKHKGIRFDKPRYRKIETLPFIPLEVEVSELISGAAPLAAKQMADSMQAFSQGLTQGLMRGTCRCSFEMH